MQSMREFKEPTKQIKSQEELELFIQSECYEKILNFIIDLGEHIRSYPCTHNFPQSPSLQQLMEILKKIKDSIDLFPSTTFTGRFGSPKYRDWFDHMTQIVQTEIQSFCSSHKIPEAAIELAPYLINSFGSKERIDYGTGHEFSFALFLYCLFDLGLLTEEDKKTAVLVFFRSYINIARTLQKKYYLEPAGSKGVWGLDDYQFLVFLWGSYQLLLQEEVRVRDVQDPVQVNYHSNEYLYFDGIKAIFEFKKGAPFAECAPLLYDISNVTTWKKVSHGLIKMYHGEVLSKLPVMQHVQFGSIIEYDNTKKAKDLNQQYWRQGAMGMGSQYTCPSVVTANARECCPY